MATKLPADADRKRAAADARKHAPVPGSALVPSREAATAAIRSLPRPLCGADKCLGYATHGWRLTVWPKNVPLESRGRGAVLDIDLWVCPHHAGLVTIASLQAQHWQQIEAWWADISDVPFDRDTAAVELVELEKHTMWRAKRLEAGLKAGSEEPAGGYHQSFVAQLSWQDLQRLRGAVRRVWLRKGMPSSLVTDVECDKVIEAMGPATREKWLKQIVDRSR